MMMIEKRIRPIRPYSQSIALLRITVKTIATRKIVATSFQIRS
jgi:hypothetical protein